MDNYGQYASYTGDSASNGVGSINYAISVAATAWSTWTIACHDTQTATVWNAWNDYRVTQLPYRNGQAWAGWNYRFEQLTEPIPIKVTLEQAMATWYYAAQLAGASERALQQQRRAQWERAEADERARVLLESLLTDEQRRTYGKHKVIYLESQKRRRYRLTQSAVHLLNEKGDAVAAFCIHTKRMGQIPIDDEVAAKVIWLKFDEEMFEKHSNRSNLRAFVRPDQVAQPAAAAA